MYRSPQAGCLPNKKTNKQKKLTVITSRRLQIQSRMHDSVIPYKNFCKNKTVMIIIKSKSGSLKTQDESNVPLLKWIEREADLLKFIFLFRSWMYDDCGVNFVLFWLRLHDGLLFFISL